MYSIQYFFQVFRNVVALASLSIVKDTCGEALLLLNLQTLSLLDMFGAL